MSIVLQGSTSGSITLQEPAVAGNTTINLPATSGTLITTGSSAALPVSAINATGTPSSSTFLRGDGSWQAPAGGVTSAVAGNGISVSGATGAVTFAVACPTYNTVGSYVSAVFASNGGQTATGGSNYSVGTGLGQIQAGGTDLGFLLTTNNLSGTWKWMGATYGGATFLGLACRVS